MEATKFGKKICVIGDSHLNRVKRNNDQKLVNRGKAYFNVFQGALYSEPPPPLHKRGMRFFKHGCKEGDGKFVGGIYQGLGELVL